ncbi:MAG: hypothetical protein NTX53_06600 [candidate division WOR-3 bacterium]|nr:hypothetical protein [candidate division WOR-3 bacterium]
MISARVECRNYRNSATYSSAVWLRLCAFALALGMLLASAASAQVLDGVILLPDSLGPLTGKTHVAFDENPAHPRIFIGSENADVLVADALTGERLERIATGRVYSLCYSMKHNRLYAFTGSSVVVVDCSSYQIVKELHFMVYVNGLFYNSVSDRLYCTSDPMKVIDCAADSIVDSLPVHGAGDCFGLDSVRNKLYVGTTNSLVAIDCATDSVVATIQEVRSVAAICCNPTAGKVYASAGETLFAVSTQTDTVVFRLRVDTLDPQLACDPVHNRVYYTYRSNLIALDCERDSTIWTQSLGKRAIGLVAVPAFDKLYMLSYGFGTCGCRIIDGTTGQILHQFDLGSDTESTPYYCPAAQRVFAVTPDYAALWIDCDADSICGGIPLSMRLAEIYSMCVDTVHNKLYFCDPSTLVRGYVGVIDCASNKVTSYSTAFDRPSWLTYYPPGNKLYACSYDSCIFVYDCAADTILKVIRTGDNHRVYSLYWHPTLNKLYAVIVNYPGGSARLAVIDPVSDTIVKVLPLRGVPKESFLVPELNQFWAFYGYYTVVDCLRDSILMDTMPPWYCAGPACCSPLDRRVYALSDYGSGGDSVLYVLDMDTQLTVNNIRVPTRWYCTRLFGAARAHKLYWVFHDWDKPDSAFVVDSRSDSIVGKLRLPPSTGYMLSDRSGDYMYFFSDTVAVLDTRTDSVVNRVGLPLYCSSIVKNGATNRLYLAGRSDAIQVVHDSVVLPGVHSAPSGLVRKARPRTLFSRSLPLRSETDEVLFDASGRRVAVLRPGANSIAHLAPGVYFMREAQYRVQAQPVCKIVIAK